jgi:hypothetical protein
MSTAQIETMPARTNPNGGPEGRLKPWKDAANAMPIMDVLRRPIALAPPLWIGKTGDGMTPVMIATRGDIKPADYVVRSEREIVSVEFQRLDMASALAGIDALYPNNETMTVGIIGPEPDALDDVKGSIKTTGNLNYVYRSEGRSLEGIIRACDNADNWHSDMSVGIRQYLQGKNLLELPATAVHCACLRVANDAEIDILINEGFQAFCDAKDITAVQLHRKLKGLKKDLLDDLHVACAASTMAYRLHSIAKLICDEDIAGFRAIGELGVRSIERYARYAALLGSVDAHTREKVALKLIKLVGQGSEAEVRDEFKVPKPVFVVVKKEVQAPPKEAEKPSVAVREERPAEPHVTLKEQVLTMARVKDLEGIPVGFIAECFRKGIRDADGIIEAFTSPPDERPAQTEKRRQAVAVAPVRQIPAEIVRTTATLEERIAAIRFSGPAAQMMEARGIDPFHVSLAVCKVLRYPTSPQSRKTEQVTGYLANYLKGEVRNPVKAADSVLGFLNDADLLVGNERVVGINAGTKHPIGSAILANIRAGFPN